MINYSNEGFAPFSVSVLFTLSGSVVPTAFLFALPPAIGAILLTYVRDEWAPDIAISADLDAVTSSQLWAALTAVLAMLISFRTNKAYSRFWDGTTLLHQMWGEWFDACSCLVAFTTLSKRTMPDMVDEFRMTLIRLMSLCHGAALDEIALSSDTEEGYPNLDPGGLDQSTLMYLRACKFDENLNFNRVEVVIHMIQTLVVNGQDNGVLKIPPPILSRVFQTISRGQVNLANCKKMTSTLFPFPYAQLIAVLSVTFSCVTPIVMVSICRHRHWAFLFTLVPIFGIYAMNYVARELEMPFGEDPNDLPLIEFQEHMNKSLLMLIRPETDHVVHTGENCARTYDDIKTNTTTKRPKHFIRESTNLAPSESSESVIKVYSPKAAAPKAAPPPDPPKPPAVSAEVLALQKTIDGLSSSISAMVKVQEQTARHVHDLVVRLTSCLEHSALPKEACGDVPKNGFFASGQISRGCEDTAKHFQVGPSVQDRSRPVMPVLIPIPMEPGVSAFEVPPGGKTPAMSARVGNTG